MEPALESSQEHPQANPSSIAYRIDRDASVVFLLLTGDVEAEALVMACENIFRDDEFVPGMDVCVECRVLTNILPDEQIRALALSALFHRAGTRIGRVAIVATTERGLQAASLFELFADAPEHRLAIFTDVMAARAWLGVTSF